MSKSEPTNWEDIDTAKVVAFVSSRINRVCNLKSPIIVHSGAVDAVAKLGREMGKQPGKDEDSRLLLNFASLDAAEILDPAREVIAFLSLNVDRYTGRTDLLQFFPAGTKSLPPMPKPENFIADITRPLIHLPLFQRHYVLFRGMVLGGRLLLEPIDKTGSFALAAMHPTRPQHSATFAAICVTFEALANCMNSFGTWLPVASALNKRVAMDPLFLDSLTYLMNLALLHYGLTVAKYMSFSAAPDDEFFDMADMVINGAFTMDPGSWIKYQKALYGKDEDKQSPAAKLRETALDVLPRLTIASRGEPEVMRSQIHTALLLTSVVLGEKARFGQENRQILFCTSTYRPK